MHSALKILFLFAVCLPGLQVPAEASSLGTTELMSAQQLAGLSPAEQLQALRIVHELAARLDKTAQGLSWLQRLELIFPEAAYAATYQGDNYQASQQAFENFQKTQDIQAGRDSLALLMAEAQRLNTAGQPIPDQLKVQFEQKFSAIYSKVDSSEQDIVTQFRSDFYIQLSGTHGGLGSSNSPAPAPVRSAVIAKKAAVTVALPASKSVNPATLQPAVTAAPASAAAVSPKVAAPKPAAASAQAPVASVPGKAEVTDDAKHCVSSGFVLSVNPRGRCNFIHNLKQTGLNSKLPFDETKFVCSGDTVLCNPVLFGFNLDTGSCPATTSKEECWEKARPICAPNQSQSLTKICQGMASTQNLKNAVEYIQGAGAKNWDDYQQSLVNLCNAKGNSTDVVDTCKVAIDQMKNLKKQVQSTPTAPAAAEGKR